MAGAWYQKKAWILLFLTGLPFLLFGVGSLLFGLGITDAPMGIPGGPEAVEELTGATWRETLSENPAALKLLRGLSRVFGLGLLGFGIFVLLVSSVSYRRGERWAWFALWTVPGFMVGLTLHEFSGSYVQTPLLFLGLSLLGLALPASRFFRRASQASSSSPKS